MDRTFQQIAGEVICKIREGKPEDLGNDRTQGIIAEALRQAHEAGKEPSSEGLNKHRLETLKEILRLARTKAEANERAALVSARRRFEQGLLEAYKFVELSIAKLERGDFR